MNKEPYSENNCEKSSLHNIRNSRAILTELHEIRTRISHISETFEAEENASSVEHKMIGYKMSHVHSKMCEYEDSTSERDEILQELSQSFTDQMKRFMFDGENSAAVLANTIIPEDLLDDLMNHKFSSEYNNAMKVNTKLMEVLKFFAKSDVQQLTKFVQVLKDAQGLGLEEKIMRVAGFFSKVPFHVQQVLLSRLRDETREEKLQAMKSNYSSQLKQKSKLPAMQSDELIDELKEVQVSAFAKVPSSHTQSNAPAVPESADTTCKQMETTQTSEERNKTKHSSVDPSRYHQYLNELNQKVLEEAKLQSKDIQEIQKILEKYDFTEHQNKNNLSVASNKTENLLHSAHQLEKDLNVFFRGKKNKWLSDLMDKIIISLPSSMKKKSKTMLHRSKAKPKPKPKNEQSNSLALGKDTVSEEKNIPNLKERSKNKPVADYSKRKAQIQYPQKTNPRISYRLSREEIHKQSQKTGRMWTNYAQIQIGTPMDTIESNEALILNEGSLQKALFNTAYPRLQVPILARQKVWGNWRVDRQSFYQGQWKQRRHITNSRTQLNNMPKFIKGQKIISTTVIPQIDSNHTMELHLQAKQPKMTDTKLNQTRKEPIHLPKISMLPDSQVKRERPTVATSKQLLFPKHTQMYKSQ